MPDVTMMQAIERVDFWDARKVSAPTNESAVKAARLAQYYRGMIDRMKANGVTCLTIEE